MVEYKLIREIEANPYHTQRSLADKLNVSLGKAHYLLEGLVEKGLVKARKLKNHPDRIRWQYNLTPKGIRQKLQITRSYLRRRQQEFEQIQEEIAQLKQEVDKPAPAGKQAPGA